MNRTVKILVLILMVSMLFALSACGDGSAPVNPALDGETAAQADEALPEGNALPDANTDAAPVTNGEDEEPPEAFTPLPAEPQPVEIITEDGRVLEGRVFPANVVNAPVVVLMHWAPGSMQDWEIIARWLQNRPDEAEEWASWFPAMPADVSFTVVTFNFGRYGNSEYGGSRESYVMDAQAALRFAASLDGADPHQIITIGASIGADGAVDGCYLFNDAGEGGTCIGALSLSPGNYLTEAFTYTQAAEMIDQAGFPVWCLAAVNDFESPAVCRSLTGEHSWAFIFPGSAHGMMLVSADSFPDDPLLDLNTVDLIQEFLEASTGMQLNEFSLP